MPELEPSDKPLDVLNASNGTGKLGEKNKPSVFSSSESKKTVWICRFSSSEEEREANNSFLNFLRQLALEGDLCLFCEEKATAAVAWLVPPGSVLRKGSHSANNKHQTFLGGLCEKHRDTPDNIVEKELLSTSARVAMTTGIEPPRREE